MTEAEGLFAAARAQLRNRDPDAAEALLQQAIACDPRHAPSLHLLGLLAGRAGRHAACVALLSRAIDGGTPEQAVASGLLLAAAYRRAHDDAAAEAAYRRVLALDRASIDAHHGLGSCLLDAGRAGEALAAFDDAIAAAPGFAPAHGARAAALLALGQIDRAAAAAETALRLAPGDAALARNLAIVRNAQGRHGEAAGLCRRALAQGEDAGLRNTLGIALKEEGALDEAGASFERALALQPGLADAAFNLAAMRKDQGRTDEAVALLRALVRDRPDLPAARFALCMAHLPPLYRDAAEIARRRAEYRRELEALIAFADAEGAGSLAAGIGAAQPFLLAYQGEDDGDLQRLYGGLVCRASAARFPPVALAEPARPGERLRVGIVSGHFRDHSVWRLPTRGWVSGLDRRGFELLGYHTSALRDAETDAAAASFDRFVQGPLSTDEWRVRIATDRPHALIYPEIGMDPEVARLAAMRLAPVQYASWGHPATSGYPTIDFFLSSADMEPADGDAHHAEALVRLSGLSTIVAPPPPIATAPSRAAHGLPADVILYWCAQSLSKYLPQHDGIYPAIAARIPESRFVFVEYAGSRALTQRFRDRLGRAFAACGLDADRHCLILPRMDAAAFRAAMGCADVVLDSIGWSGCNTLIEALGHGLPIVTLPGATMRSRHGAAILRRLGQDQWVCADAGAYVDRAVALADPETRRAAGAALRAASGCLNDARCLVELENHMRHACTTPRA